MADDVSKSWFAVFNNPADHGYHGSPQEVCDRLCAEWTVTDTRTGAWAFCVKHYVGHFPVYDENGRFVRYQFAETEEEKAKVQPDLPHVHMVLEDSVAMRFSVIKNTYAIGMHFECTKGAKKQAEAYISKTGDYDEMPHKKAGLPWEEILYVARKGEIRGRQGHRSDVEHIGALIASGATPRQILSESFSMYKYETQIRKAYYDLKDRLTPEEREIKVIWHVGESGSGKSYSRMKLIDEVGSENVYYLTDYNPLSMWDGYNGQAYLWIEDFKGGMRFGDLLRYLDKYKVDLHARYANARSLWKEVHITSVLHPLGAYRRMLSSREQENDKADQLLRRITVIRYHWVESGDYKCRDFPPTTTLESMRRACLPVTAVDYRPVSNWEELPPDGELPY